MTITLIGYMGSGKTTIGLCLAKAKGFEFIDLDQYISTKYNQSVHEIFKKNGELGFRKKERESLKEVLTKPNTVIALGGGTPVYYDNIDLINQNSISIYLQVSPASLVQRLKNKKDTRPLIASITNEELPSFISKHLFERNYFYRQAKHVIPIHHESEAEVLNTIMKINLIL